MKKWLLDILFPRHCLSCGILLATQAAHEYLCDPCIEAFPQEMQLRCAFCTSPTLTGATCRSCKPKHALDALLVTANYEDSLAEHLVKTLKYRFVPAIAADMGTLMAKRLTNLLEKYRLPRSTFLSAVPLSKHRLRWRGFNQAEELAKSVSTRLHIPYAPDILRRAKDTTPQADISDRTDRIANAKNLFEITVGPLANCTVLLVDDVSTTGATLDDAAKTLKAAGAAKVIGIVFARGG